MLCNLCMYVERGSICKDFSILTTALSCQCRPDNDQVSSVSLPSYTLCPATTHFFNSQQGWTVSRELYLYRFFLTLYCYISCYTVEYIVWYTALWLPIYNIHISIYLSIPHNFSAALKGWGLEPFLLRAEGKSWSQTQHY